MPYKNKEKRKEYAKLWRRGRRTEYFKNKVCIKCGSTEQLELDHIDPKLKTTHNIWSWSKQRQQEELKKCQILCKKCHLDKTRQYLKTFKQDKKIRDHGSYLKYEKEKCRCLACKQAKSVYAKNCRNKKLMR